MADLVPLDPFALIKPRSQPDDPLGYWWQQVGNVGRATFGVEPVNKIPRPMLMQTFPDAWALAPHVAGMLSPYLAARDAAASMGEMNRAIAAGDLWGATKNLGLGALNMAAIVPVGRVVKPAKLAMDEVSRLARADAMGFRRDMPIIIGTAPMGEQVATAAVRLKDGRVFTGSHHGEAFEKASAVLKRALEDADMAPLGDGFVTTAGRYVGRWEAQEIARLASQERGMDSLFKATRGLPSEDLLPPLLDAGARRVRVRTGTTEPGLPGMSGTWGRLLSDHLLPSSALSIPTSSKTGARTRYHTATAEAWHRATNPARLDVRNRNLQDYQLQGTLADAWGQGHDAVKVENYTRPGGTTPESVIVVRDRSQLRLPKARFDPSKKDSWDLTAGLLPILSFGGFMPFVPSAEERP